MILLYLALMIASSYLWYIGGEEGYDKRYRRMGVPIVLGVSILIKTHAFIPSLAFAGSLLGYLYAFGYGESKGTFPSNFITWIFKKLSTPAMQIDSKFIKIRETVIRGVFGALVSMAGITLALVGISVHWLLYGLICTIGLSLIHWYIKNVKINAPLVGLVVASIILLV